MLDFWEYLPIHENHKNQPFMQVNRPYMGVSNNGGTRQPLVFILKMDHFGVFWRYHHIRKHPSGSVTGPIIIPLNNQVSGALFFHGCANGDPVATFTKGVPPVGRDVPGWTVMRRVYGGHRRRPWHFEPTHRINVWYTGIPYGKLT